MDLRPIRIVLLDAHEITRVGVRALVSRCADIELVGEAAGAAECEAVLPAIEPHVIVMELDLPDRNGLEFVTELKAARPAARILVLSMYAETQMGVRALRHGADGYVCKSGSAVRIVDAIHKVAAGRKYLSAELAEILASAVADPRSAAPYEHLTTRELDVFVRIARGQSLTGIGVDLGLSVKTVATYRARILEKTGSRVNADLTRLAMAHDMLR